MSLVACRSGSSGEPSAPTPPTTAPPPNDGPLGPKTVCNHYLEVGEKEGVVLLADQRHKELEGCAIDLQTAEDKHPDLYAACAECIMAATTRDALHACERGEGCSNMN